MLLCAKCQWMACRREQAHYRNKRQNRKSANCQKFPKSTQLIFCLVAGTLRRSTLTLSGLQLIIICSVAGKQGGEGADGTGFVWFFWFFYYYYYFIFAAEAESPE